MNYPFVFGLIVSLSLVLLFSGCIANNLPDQNINVKSNVGCNYSNPYCDYNTQNCIDNQCVTKTGCLYLNPDCNSDSVCNDNICVSKEVTCEVPKDIIISSTEIAANVYNETTQEYVHDKEPYDIYTRPNSDIRIVCQKPCSISQELLEKKYGALEKSITELKSIVGINFIDKITPISFHYTEDNVCGKYWQGMTGYYNNNSDDNLGQVCLFNYDKNNIIVPLDLQNACRSTGNLLEVHEAGHALFEDANISYWIQENFVKMFSFYISGYYNGTTVNGNSNENRCNETHDDCFLLHMSACNKEVIEGYREYLYF